MDNTYFKNKDVTVAGKIGPCLKKAHRIPNKTLVVIDESLVEQLSIDDENTWFEQIQTDEGILLRIQKNIINEQKPAAARHKSNGAN